MYANFRTLLHVVESEQIFLFFLLETVKIYNYVYYDYEDLNKKTMVLVMLLTTSKNYQFFLQKYIRLFYFNDFI